MVSAATAFVVFLLIVLAACGYAFTQFGKQIVLGVGTAAAFVSASWYEVDLAGVALNVPIASVALLLIAYCMHSPRRLFATGNLIDLFVVLMVIWHFVVDVVHGDSPVMTALISYGEWGLPYAAGRYAWIHRQSQPMLARCFAAVAVGVAVLAVIESLTSMNVWELFAARDDRVRFDRSLRYGIAYRANANTRHAIFLGVTLLTMVPWATSIFDNLELSKRDRWMGLAAVVILGLGVTATLSRGPVIALFIMGCFIACSKNTTALLSSAALLVTCIALVVLFPEPILDAIESRPDQRAESTLVHMSDTGEVVKQNSARNRLLVIQVYGPLVLKGGLLGYGTAASTGFPPRNIPTLTKDPAVLRRIGIVDNAFIGIGLRFGIVGLTIFSLVFVATAWTAFGLAADASTFLYPLSRTTPIALGITVVGLALVCATVYLDRDHGFWLLWFLGSVSGIKESTKWTD